MTKRFHRSCLHAKRTIAFSGVGVVSFAMVVLFPHASSAQLSSVDILDPSGAVVPGGATRDPATGLDWLDLTLTPLHSFDDILAGAGLGTGWVSDGWRYATTAEICDFFGRYAGVPDPCPDGPFGKHADPDDASRVTALLGLTDPVGRFSRGEFDDSSTGVNNLVGVAVLDETGFVNIRNDFNPPDSPNISFGAFLVRDSTDAIIRCRVAGIHTSGRLNLEFELATAVPATWTTGLLIQGVVIPFFSIPLPAINPSIDLPLSFPFPDLGTIVIFSALSTSADGVICFDFALVDTG